MSDENISIRISDGVDPSISTSLKNIANQATAAHAGVAKLQLALNGISGSTGLQKLQTQLAKTGTAQQKLATAQSHGQIAAQALAAATTRAATAQTQGAIAAARLATAQVATGTATSNAATAANRSALSALRLSQAQAKAAQATKGATTSLWEYAKAGAAALGVGFSAKVIIEIGDAYTTLQNKLQNVTTSQSQVNLLTKELFTLANKTRAPIDETVSAFTRFDRALKTLGKSQQETLRLTETVNKALIVSGTTPQEAASALLQLSQAFNSGRLQGDEFRAVSENLPVILDAVAKALNVPINQVKALSTQGKITSEVLFKAFSLIQDKVDATFAKTLPTVGQSMVVAKNKAIEFFGELNKSVGFTTALAQGIVFLSDHIAILAAGLAVLGSAFLVAFGPAIVTAIGAVGTALKAMTLAIATNPIGLIIVGITSAIALFVLFADKIKVSADGLTSLQDVASAVWSYIAEAAAVAIDFIKSGWNALIDFVNEKTGGMGERFRDVGVVVISVLDFIVTAFKDGANQIIAPWVFAFKTVVEAWKTTSAIFDAVKDHDFSKATNAFKGFYKNVGKIASDTFSKDYLGDAAKAIVNRAGDISKARQLAKANESNVQLRGSGPDTSGGTGVGKAEIKRALTLEKLNLQLDNEANRMFKLQQAREAQAKFDKIEEELVGKKIKLTDSEAQSIAKKIDVVQKASEVQKQFDAIYNEATGPARIYNDTLEAANKLLSMGAITQDQYQRAVTKASESYKNFADPLRQYNKDLNDQFTLLTLLPKQMEIEQQMMQFKNKLLTEGITLDAQQSASIKERLELLQEQQSVSQEVNKIYSETQGAQLSLQQQSVALDEAFAMGLLTLDQYSNRLMLLGVNMANLKLQMGDAGFVDFLSASLGTLVTQYDGVLAGMSASLGNFFKSFEDGFANSLGTSIVYWRDFGDAVKNVAKSALAELIASLVKLGLQYVLNAALGKSVEAGALAAHTAMSSTAAVATAAAWAPAAAMVSLASFGANSAPASAGITATASLSESLALASLAGFENGGWTGNMARDKISGFVHGQEYVMDASTTSRVGVGNLEALQSGAASIQRNGSGAGDYNNSGDSISHKGDVNISITMAGASKAEANAAGAAAADGYYARLREFKRREAQTAFHKVKR